MTNGPAPRDSQRDQASLEHDLRRLEADVRQLEIAYTLFFAGQHPRPPLELRARVEAIIRRWDRAPIQGATERFRYTGFQLRFRSLAALWDRRMRAQEEGRPGPFSDTS